MARVTKVQYEMLMQLGTEFYPKIVPLFQRGIDGDITVHAESECAVVRSFMEMIVNAVGAKYPDDDHNDDAILSVNIGSRIINEFVNKGRG